MKAMKSKKNTIIMGICLGMLLVICAIVGHRLISDQDSLTKDFSQIDASSLPVTTMAATYVYDVTDKREAVDMADYVYIGKVLSNDGTVYENIAPIERQNGEIEKIGDPYTKYTVQVLKNIKGELRMDRPVTLTKDGGIAQDGESVLLYEDDSLPQVGQSYVFLAYAQEDGSLPVSGADSNVFIGAGGNTKNNSAIVNSPECAEYKKAMQNEIIPPQSEKSTSKYDANER
ncbi:MAG: hypothetical protein HFE75_02050 [Firmicutes bacterium]|nr:hypothetical protein [Bacillota bacterium]NBI62896.1 hypothetical protein [Clostridiales bacterium]